VSFTAHQIAEYAVGAALLAVGLHLSAAGQLLSIAAGGALLLLNLVTAARLGTFKLISRFTHHIADLVLVGALLAVAVVRFGALRAPGAALAVGLALLLLWFERLTHYRDVNGKLAIESRRRESSPLAGSAGHVSATVSPTVLARRGARTAGLVVGITRRVVRERPRSLPMSEQGPADSSSRQDSP
jgi:hypothetical protein